MRVKIALCVILLFGLIELAMSQDKVVTIPRKIADAPFVAEDSTNLFAKSYHLFLDGEVTMAADSLRKLIEISNYELNPNAYYIVVANFTDSFSPIGLFHEGSGFLDTRFYGLNSDSLFYMFISRTENAPSYVSVLLKFKQSPFEANLPAFLGLFGVDIPISVLDSPERNTTWIDVRSIEIPDKFRKNSDISVIVKKELSDEKFLAHAVFDNTSLERWSYGVATAITSIDDVTIGIGEDGSIIVQPIPNGDLAVFGVINYHFKPVDTKAPTFASSFHLLGGLRLADFIEPLVG